MAMPDDRTTLICLFHHDDQAEAAYKDLTSAGFASSSITLVGGKRPESKVNSEHSLESIGVPERDQEHLTKGLNDGGVLIAVEAFGPEQKKVEDIFRAHKAGKIDDERTDEYTNYKKYKAETQEHPTSLRSSDATASMGAEPIAIIAPATLVDDEDGASVPVRAVHIYRRSTDL